MAALIPDERCFILAGLIFFLLIKTVQAISGTSAATYKVMEPHWKLLLMSPCLLNDPLVCHPSHRMNNGWYFFRNVSFFQKAKVRSNFSFKTISSKSTGISSFWNFWAKLFQLHQRILFKSFWSLQKSTQDCCPLVLVRYGPSGQRVAGTNRS